MDRPWHEDPSCLDHIALPRRVGDAADPDLQTSPMRPLDSVLTFARTEEGRRHATGALRNALEALEVGRSTQHDNGELRHDKLLLQSSKSRLIVLPWHNCVLWFDHGAEDPAQVLVSMFCCQLDNTEALTHDLVRRWVPDVVVAAEPAVVCGEALAEQLVHMSAKDAPTIMADRGTTRKAQRDMPETRRPPNPRIFSEWLLPALACAPDSDGLVTTRSRRVEKSFRDTIHWDGSELPWRRSIVWTGIKLALHTAAVQQHGAALGTIAYKLFMLDYMRFVWCSLGPSLVEQDVGLAHHFLVKMARRTAKLEKLFHSSDPHRPSWFQSTWRTCCNEVERGLDRLSTDWTALQQASPAPIAPPPTPCHLEDAVGHEKLVEQVQARLALTVEAPDSPDQVERQVAPPTECDMSFAAAVRRVAKRTSKVGSSTVSIVEQGLFSAVLDQAVDLTPSLSAVDGASFCEKMATVLLGYKETAGAKSGSDPLRTSRMLLVCTSILYFIDKAVVEAEGILREFHPAVDMSVLTKLVLPAATEMRVCQRLENYFAEREMRSTHHMYDHNAMSHRFFEAQPRFQLELTRALDIQEQERHEKHEEVRAAIRLYTDAKKREARASHERLTKKDRYGNTYKSTRDCTDDCNLCAIKTEISHIQRSVHPKCAKLPDNADHRREITFDLLQPRDVRTWRDTSTFLRVEVIGQGFEEASQTHGDWFTKWPCTIEPRWKAFSNAVAIETRTKFTANSHYGRSSALTISAFTDAAQFYLPNGGTPYLTNSPPLGQAALRDDFLERVTFVLQQPYSCATLQRSMQLSASSTQNNVLAGQHECSPSLSLLEFVGAGSLRVGVDLQYRSLLAALIQDTLSWDKVGIVQFVLQLLWQTEDREVAIAPGWRRQSASPASLKPAFYKELMCQLERLLRRYEANWGRRYAVMAIIAIADRCLALTDSVDVHVAVSAKRCLRKCRAVCAVWQEDLASHLHHLLECSSDAEEVGKAQLAAIDVAMFGTLSFLWQGETDVSLDAEDLATWLRFAHVLDINKNALAKTSRCLLCKQLFSLCSHLGRSLLSKLDASCEVHPVVLDAFIQPMLRQQDGEALVGKWETDVARVWRTRLSSSGRLFAVHVLDGTTLANGQTTSRLPDAIIQHSTFQRLFENSVLQVVPVGNDRYQTRYPINRLSFELSCTDGNVVIRMNSASSKRSLELVPHDELELASDIFGSDKVRMLPALLVRNYSHWHANKKLLFLPKSVSDSNFPNLSARFELDLARTCGQLRDCHVDGRALLSPGSSLAKFWSAALRIEDPQFVHVWSVRGDSEKPGATGAGKALIELPRCQLAFTSTAAEPSVIRSIEHSALTVKMRASLGALTGLNGALLLGSAENESTALTVLVPCLPDHISRRADDCWHFAVDFAAPVKLDTIDVLVYRTNTHQESLVAPASKLAWLYLALLHAVTSHVLPDSLTAMAGFESAVMLLQSPRCSSEVPYERDELRIIEALRRLSPKRHFYPAHLKVMEKTEWPELELPPAVALDAYAVICDALLKRSTGLGALFGAEDTEQLKTPSLLVAQALRRSRFAHSPQGQLTEESWTQLKLETGYVEQIDSSCFVPDVNRQCAARAVATSLRQGRLPARLAPPAWDRVEKQKNGGAVDFLFASWDKDSGKPVDLTTQFWFLVQFVVKQKKSEKGRQAIHFALAAVAAMAAVAEGSDLRPSRDLESILWALCLGDHTIHTWRQGTVPTIYWIQPWCAATSTTRDMTTLAPGKMADAKVRKVMASEAPTYPSCPHLYWQNDSVKRRYDAEVESYKKASRVHEKNVDNTAAKHSAIATAVAEDSRSRAAAWNPGVEAPTPYVDRAFATCELTINAWLQHHHSELLGRKVWKCLSRFPDVSAVQPRPWEAFDLVGATPASPHRVNFADLLQVLLVKVPTDGNAAASTKQAPWVTNEKDGFESGRNVADRQREADDLMNSLRLHGTDTLTTSINRDLQESFMSWATLSTHRAVKCNDKLATKLTQFASGRESCGCQLMGMIKACVTPVSPIVHRAELTPRFNSGCLLKLLGQPSAETPRPLVLHEEHRELLIQAVHAWTEEQKARRMLKHLRSSDEAWLRKEALSPHHDWDIRANVLWLLFELENNVSLRPQQERVARQLLDPPTSKHCTMQLNMGEGKSSVILPLAATTLADGEKLVRVIVPSHLLRRCSDELAQQLGGLIGRRIFELPCRRELPIDQHLEKVLAVLRECRLSRGVLVVSPEHLLSFELKAIEVCGKDIVRRPLVAKVLSFINDHARDIVDEADDVLHFKKQVVYTVGEQQSCDGGEIRWRTIQAVLALTAQHAKRLQEIFGEETVELTKVEGYEELYLPRFLDGTNRAAAFEVLRTLIVQDFLNGQLAKVGVEIALRSLPQSDQLVVGRFIVTEALCPDGDVLRDFLKLDLHDAKAYITLRGMLGYNVLLHALSKRWRVDFGVDPHGTRAMAVPFRAKDKAAKGVEFGHIDFALCLTCISYYRSGLSLGNFEALLCHLQHRAAPDLTYAGWIGFGRDRGQHVPDELGTWSAINLSDNGQHTDSWKIVRFNPRCIDFFLENCVFGQEAKQFPHKVVANPWCLVPKFRRQLLTGFSGTRDTKLLLPGPVVHTDLPELVGTDALVMHNLMKKENNMYGSVGKGGDVLSHMADPQISVLIDVGALVLEANQSFASRWLECRKDKEAVIFFARDRLVVLGRGSRAPKKLKLSPFEGRIGECLVYLDEEHTRGTDLRLPERTHAAVTLGKGITRDKFVQACMRMRLLGETPGHTLRFLASEEVHAVLKSSVRGDPRPQQIVQWVLGNTRQQLQDGIVHWLQEAHHGSRMQARLFAPLARHDNLTDRTYKRMFTVDAHTLADSYAIGRELQSVISQAEGLLSSVSSDISELIQAKCEHFKGGTPQFSNILDEEQERELETEQEKEQQVERPAPAKARTPSTAQIDFLMTSSGAHLSREDPPMLGRQFSDLSRLWPANVRATHEYRQAVEGPEKEAAYARPVGWILVKGGLTTVGPTLHLVSPFEAQHAARMIMIATAGGASVPHSASLHLYATRIRRGQPVLELVADLTFGTNPEVNTLWLKTASGQLAMSAVHIFAGSCYFDTGTQQMLTCAQLGLCCRPHTADEATAFNRGWLSDDMFVAADAQFSLGEPTCTLRCSVTSTLLLFYRDCRHARRYLSNSHMGAVLLSQHYVDVASEAYLTELWRVDVSGPPPTLLTVRYPVGSVGPYACTDTKSMLVQSEEHAVDAFPVGLRLLCEADTAKGEGRKAFRDARRELTSWFGVNVSRKQLEKLFKAPTTSRQLNATTPERLSTTSTWMPKRPHYAVGGGGGGGGGSGPRTIKLPPRATVTLQKSENRWQGWGNKAQTGGGDDGKHANKKNKFGILGAGGDAKPKGSPLLQRAALPKAPAPEPKCKFSDAELDLKITGCLKEWLSIKDVKEVQLSIASWGAIEAVHKKFVDSMLNMGIEGKYSERKSFQELLQGIVGKDIKGSTFHAACSEFLEFLPDIMIDAPKAHSYTAMLIAAGITADPMVASILKKLTEPAILEVLYGDTALKVGLEICKEVKGLQDEARMVTMFKNLGISLTQMLEKPDDERVADLADRAGLTVLVAAASATAGGNDLSAVIDLIGSGANSDAIVAAIDNHNRAITPAFVHALNTVLVTGITAKTTCPASEGVTTPTKESEAAEEKMVKEIYGPVMTRIVDGKDDLQLHVLCSIQTLAAAKGQPPRLVDRWFDYMYDIDVVGEEVYKTYKTDEAVSKSAPYEGKNQALNTATSIYTRLDQPEEEDDGN